MNKYIIGLFILSLMITIGSIKYALKQRENAFKWENNYNSQSDSMKIVLDDNGIKTYRVQQQELSIDDLRKSENTLNQKLYQETQNSNIAKRKIQSLENIISGFSIDTTTKKKDTLIYINDTVFKKMQYIYIKDKWYEFKYLEDSNQVDGIISIKTYSDLVLTEYWDRKGFFLWRWLKRKHHYKEVKDLNPYNTINSFKVIKINNK